MGYSNIVITASLFQSEPLIEEIEVLHSESARGLVVGTVDMTQFGNIIDQMKWYMREWPKGATARFTAEWEAPDRTVGDLTGHYVLGDPVYIRSIDDMPMPTPQVDEIPF